MGAMKLVFALLAVSSAPLGVAAGSQKQKFKFGQDTDWPPYAFKNANGGLEGIGKDIVDGMNLLCDDIEIEVVETKWEDCWTSDDNLGAKLANGTLDACMTYTHARGDRDTKADWSMAFLKVAKAAGLITKLDADGKPMVCGTDNLCDKVVADVGGWAPTADTIETVKNQCDETPFSVKTADMKIISQVEGTVVNDEALKQVLDGKADALYLYADAAETFMCKNDSKPVKHNCTLWDQLGKPNGYAYIQSGMFNWTMNGTTLAMTKPGSPAAQAINHCLYKFMKTVVFYDICVKHGLECDCVAASDHFKNSGCVTPAYNMPTKMQSDCSGGFCPCDATCNKTQSTTCTAEANHGGYRHAVSALTILASIVSINGCC